MKSHLRRLVQNISTRAEFKGRVRLVRALHKHLQPAESSSLYRMPNHTWMMLNLRDPMQADIYYGLYETQLQELILALLTPGMTFFDLGAHVGFYTIAAAQKVGTAGSVHAFEPLASNFKLLESTVAANHFSQVYVNHVAVADHAGTVTLHVPNTSEHNASGFATLMDFLPGAISESVPAVSLDEYVSTRNIAQIDLIKMDIEAAEVLALRGMEHILSAPHKPRIFSEINVPRLQDAGYEPKILHRILTQYGYTPFRIQDRMLLVASASEPGAPLENVLFLPATDPLRPNEAGVIPFERLIQPV